MFARDSSHYPRLPSLVIRISVVQFSMTKPPLSYSRLLYYSRLIPACQAFFLEFQKFFSIFAFSSARNSGLISTRFGSIPHRPLKSQPPNGKKIIFFLSVFPLRICISLFSHISENRCAFILESNATVSDLFPQMRSSGEKSFL